MKSHHPSLQEIFKICYSLSYWASLNSDHIAVLYCQNGKTRTGVVSACFETFQEGFDDPLDAFIDFYQKRLNQPNMNKAQLVKRMPPSLKRFFDNFKYVVDNKSLPYRKAVLLNHLCVEGLKGLEQAPKIDIFDAKGLVFSSTDSGSGASVIWETDSELCRLEIQSLKVPLCGDFTIVCSKDTNSVEYSDPCSVCFKYGNSTAFIKPNEVIELVHSKMDIPPQTQNNKSICFSDNDNFRLGLTFYELGEDTMSVHNSNVLLPIMYSSKEDIVQQGRTEMFRFHRCVADAAMQEVLQRRGYLPDMARHATLCSNNDTTLAVQILHTLKNKGHEVRPKGYASPPLTDAVYPSTPVFFGDHVAVVGGVGVSDPFPTQNIDTEAQALPSGDNATLGQDGNFRLSLNLTFQYSTHFNLSLSHCQIIPRLQLLPQWQQFYQRHMLISHVTTVPLKPKKLLVKPAFFQCPL